MTEDLPDVAEQARRAWVDWRQENPDLRRPAQLTWIAGYQWGHADAEYAACKSLKEKLDDAIGTLQMLADELDPEQV